MDFSSCTECIQIAFDIRKRVGDEVPTFLIVDLSIRLGNFVGDSAAKPRSNIMHIFNDPEYSWMKPESGQWAQ